MKYKFTERIILVRPIGRKGKPLTNWYGDLFDGDGNYDLDATTEEKEGRADGNMYLHKQSVTSGKETRARV